MRWRKRDLWKAGVVIAGILLLLVLIVWVPVSAAGAYERASRLATPVTGTVQVTQTQDATVTALNKEKLAQEVQQLKNNNSWAWLSIFSTLGTLGTLGTIILGIVVAWINFHQWAKNREDEQKKRTDDQRIEQEKRAEDQRVEREKRDEERFQSVIEALASERTEARVGSAIMLRTFLHLGYEQFYSQVFDLVVANLRLRKYANSDASRPSSPLIQTLVAFRNLLLRDQESTEAEDHEALVSLGQALTTVFKESFRRTRDWLKQHSQFTSESLDATGIHLEKAYLCGVDLKEIWMPGAHLRGANLSGAELRQANLTGADFTRASLQMATLIGANLIRSTLTEASLERANLNAASLDGAKLINANLRWTDLRKAILVEQADLTGADLTGADLREADLTGADLTGTDLSRANLTGANLTRTHPETARSLRGTKMSHVVGLNDQNQREACRNKGASFEEISGSSARATPPAIS